MHPVLGGPKGHLVLVPIGLCVESDPVESQFGPELTDASIAEGGYFLEEISLVVVGEVEEEGLAVEQVQFEGVPLHQVAAEADLAEEVDAPSLDHLPVEGEAELTEAQVGVLLPQPVVPESNLAHKYTTSPFSLTRSRPRALHPRFTHTTSY